MLKKLFFTFFTLCILAGAGCGAWLYFLIVVEPGEEIQLENIRKILGRESHVFYGDGTTKLGVFFDTAHRQYVSYSEIPVDFVNALVASEDDKFFDHFGFDIIGISRAMIKNIEAGRVVQGGSTLTQQTAKNLFKRTDRSYEAKIKELLYALRLEYHYSKEKIFEFYANQFYVSGNGHGLGVAARYYFDKKPQELTLVECAFIAGSVKRPNYYNPFRKKSAESEALAEKRAKIRLKYVLGKMRGAGMIDDFIYNEALAADIDFKNGKVGFDLDYAMELVREAVSSSEVLEALDSHGVTNIATSGVRVITTVERGLQDKTLSALRSELSRLDVRLRGYKHDEVQGELSALNYSGDSILKKEAFIFGTVTAIEGKGADTRLSISLDKKLGDGFVDAAGLKRMVTAWVKYQRNRWSEVEKKDLDLFMGQVKVGDRVWVSVKGEIVAGEAVALSLEKYPVLQGAAVVVQNGKIRGLAGGSENRFFNRAIHAKRTMGSAFKPLVYTAAIQLGWNSADQVKNRRNVFVYHGKPYYPRPDHNSPHDWVSMSWAGVRSENVASVWLLSKLCDKLSPLEFREVAEKVGLTPKIVDGALEPYRSYKARIRDRFGIQVNKKILRQAAFGLAVKNVETDFIFDGLEDEYPMLKELAYGLNYERFKRDLDMELSHQKQPVKKYIADEYALRRSLLEHNYLMMELLRQELAQVKIEVEKAMGGMFLQDLSTDSPFENMEFAGGALYLHQSSGVFYFLHGESSMVGLSPVPLSYLQEYLVDMTAGELLEFWGSVMFEGGLSVAAFDKVAQQLEHEYQKLLLKLPFEFEVLENVDDFRTTVGLYYLIQLSKELGISSSLQPVLSFPLGSNVVSLFEATRMYEGLVTGRVTRFGEMVEGGTDGFTQGDEFVDALAILDRIESADGQILYQPLAVENEVVDLKTGLAVGSILENTVKFGTGRYADRNVKLTGGDGEIEDLNLSVPLLGKTGTANRYTNGSFLGYVPEVGENGVSVTLEGGYALGVYVGFDNNKPMRRKASRISGAAGALPAWTEIANALVEEKEYTTRLDQVDLSFYGLAIKRKSLGQVNIAVDSDQGGLVQQPAVRVSDVARKKPSIITFGKITDSGRFVLERKYQPYWITP